MPQGYVDDDPDGVKVGSCAFGGPRAFALAMLVTMMPRVFMLMVMSMFLSFTLCFSHLLLYLCECMVWSLSSKHGPCSSSNQDVSMLLRPINGHEVEGVVDHPLNIGYQADDHPFNYWLHLRIL